MDADTEYVLTKALVLSVEQKRELIAALNDDLDDAEYTEPDEHLDDPYEYEDEFYGYDHDDYDEPTYGDLFG